MSLARALDDYLGSCSCCLVRELGLLPRQFFAQFVLSGLGPLPRQALIHSTCSDSGLLPEQAFIHVSGRSSRSLSCQYGVYTPESVASADYRDGEDACKDACEDGIGRVIGINVNKDNYIVPLHSAGDVATHKGWQFQRPRSTDSLQIPMAGNCVGTSPTGHGKSTGASHRKATAVGGPLGRGRTAATPPAGPLVCGPNDHE